MSRTAILAIRIIADAAGAQKGLDKTATSLDKFEKGVQRASKYAAVGLGAVAAGALKAAESASDLAESTNAVEVVFGKASSTITDFGKTAADTAGLSQREFQTLATGTGSLLQNMGQSAQEAADNTVILAERAADMASVFNTDVGSALEAINAGLRGESEPLRAYSVSLSDAAIKAEAMALGLYDGKGALDAQARAAATTSLILEQSSKTAGDFAATSDSLAGRQRKLAAAWENTSAQLGEALLPYLEQALGYLQELVGWVSENTDTVTKLAAGTAILAGVILATNVALKIYRTAALLTDVALKILRSTTLRTIATNIAYRAIILATRAALLVWTAAQWALNVALNANPIGLIILLIAGLIAAVVLAYRRSETFRGIVQALGRAIGTVLGGAIRGVSAAFEKLVGWLSRAWDWLSKIGDKIGGVIGKLNPFRSALGAVGLGMGIPAPAAGLRTPGTTADSDYSPRAALSPTVIYVNAADPWSTARAIKRQLAGADLAAGRPAGAPQALAW